MITPPVRAAVTYKYRRCASESPCSRAASSFFTRLLYAPRPPAASGRIARIPTGFRPQAQGCESSSYPGYSSVRETTTPTGLRHHSPELVGRDRRARRSYPRPRPPHHPPSTIHHQPLSPHPHRPPPKPTLRALKGHTSLPAPFRHGAFKPSKTRLVFLVAPGIVADRFVAGQKPDLLPHFAHATGIQCGNRA